MGFFSRARNLIQGMGSPTEREVQHYGVVCPNGHRLRGSRTEGYQAIRCPACDAGVFILAASPLPYPVAPSSAPSRRPAVAARASTVVDEGPIELQDAAEVSVELAGNGAPVSDAEIIWEDEAAEPKTPPQPAEAPSAPEAPRPPRSRPAHRGRTRRTARPKAAEAPETAAAARRVAIDEIERPATRRNFRPLLIFGIVALVVVGTVALRAWRSHRQALPLVAERGRVEGIPALEEGNFDKAHQLLSAARRAVDRLGGAVEGADRIRRAADDAAIFVNLVPESLEEMLDQAPRTNPEAWATRFDSLYQGRTIVLDSRVRSSPESPEGRYEIEYVVMPPGETANFLGIGGARPERTARIDFKGFELFERFKPGVGDRVLFGARLAEFRFDVESDGWIVRFQPKSGVFIHFDKALEALGWPSASGLAATTEEP